MKRISVYLLLFAFLLLCVQPTPFDFTAIYNGASALHEQLSPYDPLITARNQMQNYGHLAEDNQDEIRVAHPLTSMMMLYPLGWFDMQTAKMLFIALSGLLFMTGMHALGAPVWWAFALFFLLREPISGFFLGQLALFSASCVIWGLACAKQGKFRAAQVWMVFASAHPVFSVPIALIVLPRRRVYLALMSVLVLAAFSLDAMWLQKWLENARAYPTYVVYMIWLPSITPLFVPLGMAIMSLRSYAAILGGLTMLLPITGSYHMSLYAPVFVKPSVAILIFSFVIWGITIYPMEVRKVLTPLFFALFTIPYSSPIFQAKLSSLWARLSLQQPHQESRIPL